MPYRRIYHNRQRRALFSATKLWAAWAAIAAASAIAVFVLAMPESVRAPSITSIRQSARGLLLGRSEKGAVRNTSEKIYPYSIIAGGVHNKQQ
ncbi:MAG: hypothetical protein KGM47_18210, partial [Acidobacteriota bacterium]|nr:hypothetical protein [Acidobacteriota bacterium]